MPNWYNQLCLLYSGCDFLMSSAICAMRCHITVYSKWGCPLVHSCHYHLKQSCHRRLVCPTSLLRQSLSILITVGSLALCASEFSSGSWLSQHLKSNRRTFFFLPACGHINSPQSDYLWPSSPEESLLGIAFHWAPRLSSSQFFLLPGLRGQQYWLTYFKKCFPYYYCVLGWGRANPSTLPWVLHIELGSIGLPN